MGIEMVPRVLSEALELARCISAEEMTMRMRICRVAFPGQGIDYERSAVRKALEEGQLEVQSTTAWLDAAVARIKAREGSASVAAADAHQDGVLELVREQALANTKWCKVQDLP